MKGSTAIRKQLGITQHELAGLLQVSRSAINLYELGKRSLPVAALLKLGQLEIVYNQAQQNRLPALRQISTTAVGRKYQEVVFHFTGKDTGMPR
jgi:transcriptional regulator with XRE-family HTH domain